MGIKPHRPFPQNPLLWGNENDKNKTSPLLLNQKSQSMAILSCGDYEGIKNKLKKDIDILFNFWENIRVLKIEHKPKPTKMKKITLKEAYQILEDASAIIIDDSTLVYPSLSELEDDELNEFMYLSWDDEGLGYYLKFLEGDNQEVKVSGSSIFLIDTDREENQITILTTKNLEE